MQGLRDYKGFTTIEVLLITPFALFFFMATIQVIQALVVQNVAASAAREAARTYAVYHDAALARERADEVISGTLTTGREGEAAAAGLEGSGIEYIANLFQITANEDGVNLPVMVLNTTGPEVVSKPGYEVYLWCDIVDGKGNTVADKAARVFVGGLKTGESRTVTLNIPKSRVDQVIKNGWALKIDLVKEQRVYTGRTVIYWRASQRYSPPRKISSAELAAALDVAEELKKAKEKGKGAEQGPAPEANKGQLSMSGPHEEKEYTCNFDPERDVKLYDDGAFCTAVVDYHIRTVCPALPKLFNPDASAWAKWIDVSGTAVFKHEIETP